MMTTHQTSMIPWRLHSLVEQMHLFPILLEIGPVESIRRPCIPLRTKLCVDVRPLHTRVDKTFKVLTFVCLSRPNAFQMGSDDSTTPSEQRLRPSLKH